MTVLSGDGEVWVVLLLVSALRNKCRCVSYSQNRTKNKNPTYWCQSSHIKVREQYTTCVFCFLVCLVKMFFSPLPGFPLDMLRCESLLGLDQATCSRVLNKNYKLLVSMAPLSNEIRPISSCTPQVRWLEGRWAEEEILWHAAEFVL